MSQNKNIAGSQPKGVDPFVVRLYILFQFFFNLLVWVPVFYEFQKRAGLTDPQIFRIQSIYYLAFCFLEIPTGWFADRFGYRTSVRWGAAVLVLANVIPPLLPTFGGFLGHFLLIGLARSLISGAASAWLYEYTLERGAVSIYKGIEGDARFYSLIGKVIAWAAIGWLMEHAFNSPYWLSAANAVVSLGIAMLLPKVASEANGFHVKTQKSLEQKVESESPLRATKVLIGEPALILIMLQGVGIFVLVRLLQVNLFQPLLRAREFDLKVFGTVMSMMTIFEAFGSKLAPKLKRLTSDLNAVTMSTAVLSLAVIAMSGFGPTFLLAPITLISLAIFSLAAGLAFPVQRQVMNDAIHDSSVRATLLSMESIVDRAVCAICVLPLGALIEQGALGKTLAVSGASTLVFAGIVHRGASKITSSNQNKQTTSANMLVD